MPTDKWYTDTYYVDKTTGTSADQELATGDAVVLQSVLAHSSEEQRVYIADAGPYYIIELPRVLTPVDVERVEPFTLVSPLYAAPSATAKDGKPKKVCKLVDAFNYDKEREARVAYSARMKLVPPELRAPDARIYRVPELVDMVGSPPHEDLPLYTAIRGFKVVGSVNDLIAAWQELSPEAVRDAVRVVLQAFQTTPNDLDGAAEAWAQARKRHAIAAKSDVTLLQMLNPVAGKGANRPKANAVTVRQLDGFWLLELLKLVGYFRLAAPMAIQGTKDHKGAKDRKTYVLRPRRVELDTITKVMKDFRAVLWSTTSVKMDVLAVLRFVEVYLHWREKAVKEEQSEHLEEWLEEIEVTSMVEGFDVTFSKDMGNALATMNMATLNLPGWLPPADDLPAVEHARDLVKEHVRVIRMIGNRGPGKAMEEGADEYELLRDYRDFLSSRGDLRPFGRFAAAYGPYLLAQRDRKRSAMQFTTENLEVLMDAQQDRRYSRIVNDPGFRSIAGCIRQATVIAQYRTAQQNDRRYEIRYGLGQELERKAAYPDEFLEALAEFLHSYSAETTRQEELLAKKLGRALTREDRRTYHLRLPANTQDIAAMYALVDEFGSPLVCASLLAFGYARDARDPSTAGMDTTDAATAIEAGDENTGTENE